jgi:hypothetical protein
VWLRLLDDKLYSDILSGSSSDIVRSPIDRSRSSFLDPVKAWLKLVDEKADIVCCELWSSYVRMFLDPRAKNCGLLP